MGASYGSRLLAAGQDLKVVADRDRIDRYRAQPTLVNGIEFEFPAAAGERAADLVIVAVKNAALSEAIELINTSVVEGTVIISLLNGIDSEQVLARAFPQAQVLLSLTVGIDAVRLGREVHYTCVGRIVFGEPTNSGESAPAVARVAQVLSSAGIEYSVPADMTHQLWWKFMINAGVNQVSAVLGAPYRAFQRSDSPARAAMIAAQREVIAVANAEGIGLGEKDLQAWLEVLAKLGPDNYTSMAQDSLAGRVTEVDIFADKVGELGARHGIPTPVNDLLGQLLRAGSALPARAFG